MVQVIIRKTDDYGDERRAGRLTGVHSQIAADPLVHEYWPMHPSFMSGVTAGSDRWFECRPAKSKHRSMVLRPAEFGYRPQHFALGDAGWLRFGRSNNGGPAGGDLGDLHPGALMTGIDARVFPLQDAANGLKNSWTIITAFRIPDIAVGDDVYPGAIVGTATEFADSSGTLTMWAGIAVGLGTSSEDDLFVAGRGTTGRARSTRDYADDTWRVVAGSYDAANALYKLWVNGALVASTAVPAGVASQPSVQRAGYTAMRVASAGDIGAAALERTLIGDVGPITILHGAGDDGDYATARVRSEGALADMFGL